MASYLVVNEHRLALPETLSRPPAKGERMNFVGFSLVVQGVEWDAAGAWDTEIECSVIRGDWNTDLNDLLANAGFTKDE